MPLDRSDWHQDVDIVFRNPPRSLRTPAMQRRYAIRRQVYVTVLMRSGLTTTDHPSNPPGPEDQRGHGTASHRPSPAGQKPKNSTTRV